MLRQVGFSGTVPKDLQGIKGTLANILEKKKLLLLFDNINSRDQVDDLLQCCKLVDEGSCILFTCRDCSILGALDNASKILIDFLPFDDSVSLICEAAEVASETIEFGNSDLKSAVLDAAKACDGLPLALKVLGSSLKGDFVTMWKVCGFSPLQLLPSKHCYTVSPTNHDASPSKS